VVPFVAVDGQLSPVDGAVELVAVAIDLTPPMQDKIMRPARPLVRPIGRRLGS
jgi:hypothetical protein